MEIEPPITIMQILSVLTALWHFCFDGAITLLLWRCHDTFALTASLHFCFDGAITLLLWRRHDTFTLTAPLHFYFDSAMTLLLWRRHDTFGVTSTWDFCIVDVCTSFFINDGSWRKRYFFQISLINLETLINSWPSSLSISSYWKYNPPF